MPAKFTFRAIPVLWVLCILAPGSDLGRLAAEVVTSQARPANYVLQPNDVLIVTVAGESVLSGQIVVRPDGKIRLKIGNEIVAVGLTSAQVGSKITEELKRYFRVPVVDVQIREGRASVVHVTGAVAKPGTYPFVESMTIADLIALGGGLLTSVDKNTAWLLSGAKTDAKGQPARQFVDLGGSGAAASLPLNAKVSSGDQLVVEPVKDQRLPEVLPRPSR